jgi:predicted Zn-dependent protease
MTPPVPDAGEAARLAGELVDRHRIPQARRLLGEALARDPEHPGLLFESARAHWHAGDHGAARETLEHLLRRQPTHVDGLLMMVNLLGNVGEVEQAELLARAMLEQFPQWPGLLTTYARAVVQHDVAKARSLVDQALRLAPDDDDVLGTKVLCDIVEDLPVDEQALQRLMQQYPDEPRVLALAMAAHEQKRHYTEALHLARELLRRDPQNPLWLSYVRRLRMAEHWLLLPWRPFERFGPIKVITVWVLAMPCALLLERSHPRLCNTLLGLAGAYMAWCLFVVPVLVALGARIRRD